MSADTERPRSPYLRAARAILEEHRPDLRPKGQEGPLPTDWRVLADYLARADCILRDLRQLDTAERDESGRVSGSDPVFEIPSAFRFSSLTWALMATRPWGEMEPSELGVTDEDQEHYLTPLAIGLAGGWQLRDRGPSGSTSRRRNPKDTDRLRAVARDRGWDPDEVKVELVRTALLSVQLNRETPQEVKVGRTWETGDDGTKRPTVPTGLLHADYLRWFRAQVLRTATELLRAEAPPELDGSHEYDDPTDSMGALQRAEDTSLLRSLAVQERSEEVANELEECRRHATPKQRRVLDALLVHLRNGLDMKDAKPAAAVNLYPDSKKEKAVENVNKHLKRLNERCKERRPA